MSRRMSRLTSEMHSKQRHLKVRRKPVDLRQRRLDDSPVYGKGDDEMTLQRDVIFTLRALGYTVLSTSSIGAHTGSLGVPDLLICRPGWTVWIGIELKHPSGNGKTRPAQAELERAGHLIVAHRWEDIEYALMRTQQSNELVGGLWHV
jgi:hypothetical protein